MANLTNQQIKDSYQSVLTTSETTSNPTTGTLQNGKGTAITALGVSGTVTATGLTSTSGNILAPAGKGIAFSGDETRIITPEDNVSGALLNWGASGLCRFVQGSTERMRIDASGNVGVGGSGGSAKMQVTSSSDGADVIRADTNSNSGVIILRPDGANGNVLRYGGGGANADVIRFLSGGDTERVRIDASGNVGVGVTPSAWDTSFIRAIEIGDKRASISSLTSGATGNHFLYLNNNAYYTAAGFRYAATTGADVGQYVITSGEHRWLTAPPGTGGDVITFTERMRIDASGNVGVGTDNPGQKFDVAGNIRVTSESASTIFTNGANLITGTITDSTCLYSGSMLFGTGSTERMRITSAGVLELSQGQIKFPATQVASSDPNTLDDYEEGTWTPTLSSDATPPTVTSYTDRVGRYTKIGNLVTVICLIRATITAIGTGTPKITGLPFSGGDSTPGAFGLIQLLNAYPESAVSGTEMIMISSVYKIETTAYLCFTASYSV